jgi:cell division septation protein DedD
MFGGGSPVFAQMPVYTPVTRGHDLAPEMPEPPQQPYAPYSQPAPQQPHQQAGMAYPGQAQSPLNYPSQHSGTPQNFQTPQPAPNYQAPQTSSPANYLNIHTPQAPNRQAADFQPEAYRQAAQPAQPQNFPSAQPGAQNFAAPGYGGSQGFTGQPYQGQSFGQASFSEPASLDASFPETGFDQNFAGANFADQNFGRQSFGDASFPEPSSLDASFPDTSFAAAPSFDQQERPASESMNAYARSQPQADHGAFDTFAEEPAQDYGMASGEVPPSDPRRQLQAFDALYDQPPQIALGSTEPARRAAQDFFESERVDADFLDEGQVLPPPNAGKKPFKGRSIFMVGSALLGAIALGGALAFAYKQSGGGLSGELPLVTADNRPVKELPQDPGGKEFPHKNKLIYDRLTNGDEPESVQLTPRQENVAVPAMPPSMETAGMPVPVASTDLGAPPTTQSVNGEALAPASSEDTMPDGGPRKVKTMVVRPDGSVMESEQAQAAAAPAPAAAPDAQPQMMPVAVPAPAPDPAPQQTASVQAPPATEPKPAAQPAPQQTAALAPQPAAAPAKYVVQVASKKNQTEALASFADMQQKYPSLLASYKPIVQKADLGDKGVWYRLRIGPIADKSSASKLCSQLKQQGLPDCLVMAAQ